MPAPIATAASMVIHAIVNPSRRNALRISVARVIASARGVGLGSLLSRRRSFMRGRSCSSKKLQISAMWGDAGTRSTALHLSFRLLPARLAGRHDLNVMKRNVALVHGGHNRVANLDFL